MSGKVRSIERERKRRAEERKETDLVDYFDPANEDQVVRRWEMLAMVDWWLSRDRKVGFWKALWLRIRGYDVPKYIGPKFLLALERERRSREERPQ